MLLHLNSHTAADIKQSKYWCRIVARFFVWLKLAQFINISRDNFCLLLDCISQSKTKDKCNEYGMEIRFGMKKESLSVSVVAPPDTASVVALYENDSQVAPWTLFQVTYGRSATV